VFVDTGREVGIPLQTTVVAELSSFLFLIHDLSFRTVTREIMEIYKNFKDYTGQSVQFFLFLYVASPNGVVNNKIHVATSIPDYITKPNIVAP
jgi:hypothetical protein